MSFFIYLIKYFRKFSIVSVIFAIIFSGFLPSFNVQHEYTAHAADVDEAEERLREELEKLEKEQAALEASLNEQKSKTATIQRDVNILADQIKQAELNIRKKNLEIQNLQSTIQLKQNTVTELTEKLEKSKKVLAELIRKANEIDGMSLPEIMLTHDNLTDFFSDIDSYSRVDAQLQELYKQIQEIKSQTEEEKEKLTIQQNKETDFKKEIERQKTVVASKKSEQDVLLNVSKQSEASYEVVLAEKRQQAAAIRTALFQLRDGAGIPFGDALKYAEKAERATGVRAAFILGILKQESNLGQNVGTCNRPQDPPEKKWYSIMPGPDDGSWRDDQTIYKSIVKRLGLDVDSMPLSCPWQGGWGGAMGPSQFIPVTWQSYESKIASAVGVKTPNPWNPEHAVMATALYVKDLGAAAGGYTAERTAALKYYAGSNWSLPANAFYGNSVINHTTSIQQQIDFLADVD